MISSLAVPAATATSLVVELSRLAQTPEIRPPSMHQPTARATLPSEIGFCPLKVRNWVSIRLISEEDDNISRSAQERKTRAQNGNFLIYSFPSPGVAVWHLRSTVASPTHWYVSPRFVWNLGKSSIIFSSIRFRRPVIEQSTSIMSEVRSEGELVWHSSWSFE